MSVSMEYFNVKPELNANQAASYFEYLDLLDGTFCSLIEEKQALLIENFRKIQVLRSY